MYIFGYICLLLALVFSAAGGSFALLRLWKPGDFSASFAEKSAIAVAGALLLAGAALLHGLYWQDYRLDYVASYTDSFLPVFYRLTAFWAGQPGSMLFWALCAALCGLLFLLTKSYKACAPRTKLWFWAYFYLNMAFFCLLLAGYSNPFIMREPVPVDGNGLNPLLQNPGMIFHPPLLFMGYAGLGIPGCLALASSTSGESDGLPWFAATRSFILVSWLLLSAGIILGGWWAYMELGWGGYWGWDPVENASLLPWLFATAALHILAIERATGKLSRMAALFMSLTLLSAWFATWLTRSGIIQSVHAFGDGGVGLPLAVFLVCLLAICLLATICAPKTGAALDAIDSRQGALVLAAWIFVALALIIAMATMWPVLSAIWSPSPQGLEAGFYNRVCLPLLALLLLVLAFCPWLSWDKGIAGIRSRSPLIGALLSMLAGGAVIWLLGYQKPLPLVVTACAIAVLCNIIFLLAKKAVRQNPRALASACAHFGLAIMAIGPAFSGAYTTEKDMLLAPGQSENIGSYKVTLKDLRDGQGAGYDWLKADLVFEKGGEVVASLGPERRVYEKFGAMQFSEVDVATGPGGDIYASLLGLDEDLKVLVRVSLEPMVSWIWLGGWLMCLLPLLGLWRRRPARIAQ